LIAIDMVILQIWGKALPAITQVVLDYKMFKGSKMKGKAKISAIMITNTNVDGELSIT